jgi:hypothetical protein
VACKSPSNLCQSDHAGAHSPQAKRDKYIAAGKVQLEKRDYARALLNSDEAEKLYKEPSVLSGVEKALADVHRIRGQALLERQEPSEVVRLNPPDFVANLKSRSLETGRNNRDRFPRKSSKRRRRPRHPDFQLDALRAALSEIIRSGQSSAEDAAMNRTQLSKNW